MTKSFLEPITLQKESEVMIKKVFSKKNFKKILDYKIKESKLKRNKNRKLSIKDLLK